MNQLIILKHILIIILSLFLIYFGIYGYKESYSSAPIYQINGSNIHRTVRNCEANYGSRDPNKIKCNMQKPNCFDGICITDEKFEILNAPNQTRQLQEKVNELEDRINQLDSGVSNELPIGSIYISTVQTNPNTLLGYGTWEIFSSGSFLIGSGEPDFSLGSNGGNNEINITEAQLPNHHHDVSLTIPCTGNTNGSCGGTASGRKGSRDGQGGINPNNERELYGNILNMPIRQTAYRDDYVSDNYYYFEHRSILDNVSPCKGTQGGTQEGQNVGCGTGLSHKSVGSGESINIMPPYIVVNIWKRIR